MRKYKWSLLKTLEFLNSRRPDLEIRATFIQQLSMYEVRLKNIYGMQVTSNWEEMSEAAPTFASEELVLRNTFVNSQTGPMPPPAVDDTNDTTEEKAPVRAIKWVDEEP